MGVFSLGFTLISNKGNMARHNCIEVRFGCKKCGHKFRRTYDLVKSGKRARNGQYMKINQKYNKSELKI